MERFLNTQWAHWAVAGLQVMVFAVFAYDKACALASRSRVPNVWLRVLAAVAGPGALLSMLLFRHKIRYPTMLVLAGASCAAWSWLLLR